MEREDDRWLVARRRLLSVEELPGWALYAFGLVELIGAWPWQRPVGAIAIALGLLDHARGVRKAWRSTAR